MKKGRLITYFAGKKLTILLLLLISFNAFSQVDKEFWFVVPELSHRGNTGGTPGTFRIATLDLESTVTISMPANQYNAATNPTGFQDIVIDIPANSTAAVDLSHLIDINTAPTIVGLENKPITANGINNYGIHIVATNMITVYWEVNYDYGSDLWTLKGTNGMGTLFYTPFQTIYNNYNMLPRAYSAIDIVSTEDNNEITITLPPGKAASFGSLVTGILAGTTHTVTLHRGQTFSLYPRNYSTLAADRLAGTRIESTAPVSVTVKDDALMTAAQDLVGDQLVPVSIIGDNYIVPEMANPNHVYVLATQNNTAIYAADASGTPISGTPFTTLNAGEQTMIELPGGSKFTHITSRADPSVPAQPFYVFQMGIENASRGGALVPAIGCTGNTQLAFTRARDDKFYFFVMTEKGSEANFLIDGNPSTGLIDPDPTKWTEVDGTEGWVAYMSSSIPASKLAEGQHLVQNTSGIFHLAIINGFPAGPHGRLYYGYYSDFGGLNVGANVAGTNSVYIKACYGEPVQLYAFGGTTYDWSPDAFLDDGSSNMPTATNLPAGPHNFEVDISGGCGSGTENITIVVASPIVAQYTTDVTSGCSPLKVEIEDHSTGAFSWDYDFGDGTEVKYDFNDDNGLNEPPDPIVFTKYYYNSDTVPDYDTITLLAKNESGCADIVRRTIAIFPEVISDFTADTAEGCHPLLVNFTNNSSGDIDRYFWEFDDGGSSVLPDPSHLYINPFDPDPLVFNTRLITTSPYNCKDTSYFDITVNPYIEAKFAYDTVAACSPHDIILSNESIGADSCFWDFGDGTFLSSNDPKVVKQYENKGSTPVTYTITLEVYNEEGCFDSTQREVTIYPEVDTDFTPGAVHTCSPATISFENKTTGATSWLWDFGDGGSSTEENPNHLFERNLIGHDTVYRVSLIAISDEYCTDTAWVNITVHPFIEAAFTTEQTVGCDPFEVSVDNETFGADFYKWDFGDTTATSSSSDPVITHIFENDRDSSVTFHYELVAWTLEGCYDTTYREITVHPDITIDFTANTFEGCHPLSVNFINNSLNADVYVWDFGDGAASTNYSPSHTFVNFGEEDTSYIVKLKGSTSDGVCVKETPWPVLVHPIVTSEFTFEEAAGCNEFLVEFENLSIGGGSFFWDFGNDDTLTTTSTASQVHNFINADFESTKTFNVSLTASNIEGCSNTTSKNLNVFPDIEADFIPSIVEGCNPLTVNFQNNSNGASSYIWDFGDGSTSDSKDPQHIFVNTSDSDTTFTVKLLAIAANNVCMDSAEVVITVYSFIDAKFVVQDELGCTPFEVFMENASVNGNSFHWKFSDNTDTITNTAVDITHSFSNSSYSLRKKYDIRLVISNSRGCMDSLTRTISVEPDIRAAFTASDTMNCNPLTVVFSNESSGDYTYEWDFGNGNTSDEENPTQVFTNLGKADSTYTVELTVTASNNTCKDSTTQDILVYPFISAAFTFTNNLECTPSTVVFQNASVGGTSYTWDFGNGDNTITLDKSSVSSVFTNSGYTDNQQYNVHLLAENDAGCTAEKNKTVGVYPDVQASIEPSETEGCHPFNVFLDNQSQGGDYYTWDFGDGASLDVEITSHQFVNYTSSIITRDVILYARSENDCHHEDTIQITIHPRPVARFETAKQVDCPPFELPVTNTSLYANQYFWDFGDGETLTETNLNTPVHIYENAQEVIASYNLKLVAQSDFGCTDSSIQKIYVYPHTIADFSINDKESCSPLFSQFTNNSLRASTYSWDFGDGSFTSSRNPSNMYFNFGGQDTSYIITLISNSPEGCNDTHSDTVFVYAQPDVEFDATPPFQEFPDATVQFENLSKKGYWEYNWDFGDGNTYSGENPIEHTYDTWNKYTIWLKAHTPYCVDSVSHSIEIFATQPIAEFDTVYPDCEPLIVDFENQSLYGSEYLWDFGDGTTSTEFNPPPHEFTNDGMYHITLRVSGDGGIDYKYYDLEVYPTPIAKFKISPEFTMLPDQETMFYNQSEDGEFYFWDFGDGTTSTEKDPSHLYTEVGEYDVTLEVSTSNGCMDELTKHGGAIVQGEGDMKFPNVFVPDPGGPNGGLYDLTDAERNNIFHPAWIGVRRYKLEIYNRWGEKLFESEDINIGWDGYYKGELCPQGVYVWKVSGNYNNLDPFIFMGDVTLLHYPDQ